MINVLRSQFKGKLDIRHSLEPTPNNAFSKHLRRELPSVIMEKQHPLNFLQLPPFALGTLPKVPQGDEGKYEEFISRMIWKRDNRLQVKDAETKREMINTIKSIDFENIVIRKALLVDMMVNNGGSNEIYDEWKEMNWDFDTPYLLTLMVCLNPLGFDKQNQYLWINKYLDTRRKEQMESEGNMKNPIDLMNNKEVKNELNSNTKLLHCDFRAFNMLDSLLYKGHFHFDSDEHKIDWRVSIYNQIQDALTLNEVKRAIEVVEMAFEDKKVNTFKALQYCIEEGYHMWYYDVKTIKGCKLKHDWLWIWDNYYMQNHNIGGLKLRNRVKGIIDMYK